MTATTRTLTKVNTCGRDVSGEKKKLAIEYWTNQELGINLNTQHLPEPPVIMEKQSFGSGGEPAQSGEISAINE